jgi:predicted nucleic acid-binding protein
MSPEAALALLEANFIREPGDIAALNAADYLEALRAASSRGVAGGAVYDAVIAACAEKASATAVLTFNRRDFERLASPGLAVTTPS